MTDEQRPPQGNELTGEELELLHRLVANATKEGVPQDKVEALREKLFEHYWKTAHGFASHLKFQPMTEEVVKVKVGRHAGKLFQKNIGKTLDGKSKRFFLGHDEATAKRLAFEIRRRWRELRKNAEGYWLDIDFKVIRRMRDILYGKMPLPKGKVMIELPCHHIFVWLRTDGSCDVVGSSLIDLSNSDELYNHEVMVLESFILCAARNGVNIQHPSFIAAIEELVDGLKERTLPPGKNSLAFSVDPATGQMPGEE